MQLEKVAATTRVISKRNDVPLIKDICKLCGCKKNRLKKEGMNRNPGQMKNQGTSKSKKSFGKTTFYDNITLIFKGLMIYLED